MFRKILAASLVTVALVGATVGNAEARNGQNGAFAAGAVLGLIGGGLLANSYNAPAYQPVYEPTYYAPTYHRIRCHYEQRFVEDYYDGHYETVKFCR